MSGIGAMEIGTAANMLAALKFGTLETLLALVSGELRRQGHVGLANSLADAADKAGEIRHSDMNKGRGEWR